MTREDDRWQRLVGCCIRLLDLIQALEAGKWVHVIHQHDLVRNACSDAAETPSNNHPFSCALTCLLVRPGSKRSDVAWCRTALSCLQCRRQTRHSTPSYQQEVFYKVLKGCHICTRFLGLGLALAMTMCIKAVDSDASSGQHWEHCRYAQHKWCSRLQTRLQSARANATALPTTTSAHAQLRTKQNNSRCACKHPPDNLSLTILVAPNVLC